MGPRGEGQGFGNSSKTWQRFLLDSQANPFFRCFSMNFSSIPMVTVNITCPVIFCEEEATRGPHLSLVGVVLNISWAVGAKNGCSCWPWIANFADRKRWSRPEAGLCAKFKMQKWCFTESRNSLGADSKIFFFRARVRSKGSKRQFNATWFSLFIQGQLNLKLGIKTKYFAWPAQANCKY